MCGKAMTSFVFAGAAPFRQTVSAKALLAALLMTIGAVVVSARADDAADDLSVDRNDVFEFTKKPTATRDGGQVTIRFASRDYCDVAAVTLELDRGRGHVFSVM